MGLGPCSRILAAAALCAFSGGAASATPAFFQGYETDTAGWFTGPTSWSGSITREDQSVAGVTPFEGNFYGRFQQTNEAGGLTGPFSRLGDRPTAFPGEFAASTAIFLDLSMAAGEGFDYSVAASRTNGDHLRDFIFHVTKDTSTGKLLVGGSNNTNFDPREDLETINNFEVTESGWYIFEHLFRDDGGVLAVDLNLKDMFGLTLFTETRSTPSDLISGVAGHRYAWFTNIDVQNGILVDATSIGLTAAVPVPAALPLLATAIGVLGFVSRRRRAAA